MNLPKSGFEVTQRIPSTCQDGSNVIIAKKAHHQIALRTSPFEAWDLQKTHGATYKGIW
jgi:hypothetical protein